ncbi:MAG: phosphoesterase [Actinomycetia bacterium]|nr:phosphoesterase [Actinomycetes bacterium]
MGQAVGQITGLLPALPLPAPQETGIQHVVVVTMENRSFDHLLGWVPGADGKQAGLAFPDASGRMHSTYHLTSYDSCANNDPDHSYEGGRAELDYGKADGWLLDPANDELAIGYFERADLAFFGKAVDDWTICDRYFAATLGPTYPNRIYQHAGATDRLENTTNVSQLPTIWDRLAAKGLTGRYYFSDIPFLALWGSKHLSISRRIEQFFSDAATGQLPDVAFVDPRFGGEDQGASNDDHPRADIRAGERFLNDVYDAVRTSPNWPNTVLVVTYDEWGGFFDHVVPAIAPDASPLYARRGFRVPAVVVSPFAAKGAVDHTVYDHTSVLRLIEWRWGLDPLSPRDAGAANLVNALDLSRTRSDRPSYSVPTVAPAVCVAGTPVGETEWADLATTAKRLGFPL